jgi:hypothetical protein
MSNLKTNYFQGDVYIEASSEPSIYGNGRLYVDGDLEISGGIISGSMFHSDLSGLSADDHLQYALLAGRASGQILSGGSGSGDSLTLRSTTNATKGSIIIDENTPSSSNTTGALVVSGGIGIGGALYSGGGIFDNGNNVFSIAGINLSSSGNTINLINNPSLSGILTITNTTPSLSNSTGSVLLSGGLGISNTTDSVSSLNGGALTIAGGASIAKSVFIGQNLTIGGTLTASISHSGLTGLTSDDHTQYALLAGRAGGQILTGGTAASNVLTLRSTTNAAKGSILIDETTTSSSTTTGALRVAGGTGIVGNLFTGGTGNFAGILNATSGTASTSTTTGALVVTGGTGISGNLNVGGNVSITGSLTATIAHSSLTGLTSDDHTQYTLLAGRAGGQILTGGTAASNVLTLRSTTNATKGSVLIDETTVSTSTTTGALRVAGGTGIVGNLFTGGTGNFAGILNATSGTASTSTTTGALVIIGGTGISGNLFTGGTGNFAGILNATSGTASTSTTTGALVVTGGTGISGNLNVGGNLNVTGTLTATIAHSSLTGLTSDDHTQYALLAGRAGGQILTGGTAASNILTLRSTTNATKGSVLIDETTVSTSTTTGALRVAGGTGIVGNLFTGGTGNFAGILNATSGTASTSTTTGALVVTGGTGISGNLNVGGNLNVTGTLTASISHSSLTGLTADDHTQYALLAGRTGGQILTGGTAASNVLTLRSTTNATKGSVLIDETTVSTSTTTGALRVAGGIGVSDAVYSGNGLYDSGNRVFSIAGSNLSNSGSTINVVNNPSFSGIVNISNNTSSTSNTTGALNVVGGISSSNTTDATSVTNGGSLTLAGGAAIAKKVFIGDTISVNTIDMNSTKIINLQTPTNPNDAANKIYVDNAVQGLDIKNSVKIATTTSGTFSSSFQNGSVIDDIIINTGDRILIKNQISGIENGIYIVNISGSPTRSADFDTSLSVGGSFVFVEQGTINQDSGWVCTNDNGSDIVGTNSLSFVQFSGAGQIIAGVGLTKSGNTLSVNSSQVQITEIGTITTGTWNSSIIGVEYGGTGNNTFTVNSILLGNGTSPIYSDSNITYSSNTLTLPKITSNDTTSSTSSISGSVLLSGGLGISNATDSVSSLNGGALTIAGGAAIAKSVFIGQNLTIGGTLTASISHSGLTGLTSDDHTQYALLAGRVGGQILTGGTAASNVLTLRSTTNATKGSVLVDETTASSSTTTGALRVSGGTGIVGNLFTGGTGNFAGILNATSGTASSSTTTGALVVTGGTGISGNLNVGGNLNVTGTFAASIAHSSLTGLTADDHTQYTLLAGRAGGQILTGGTAASNVLTLRSTSNATKGSVLVDETTASSSTTTGALRVSGGTGIVGNLFTGGTGNFAGILNASSGTASTNTTTGALVVTGGTGISGGLFTGGTGNFAGILNATSGTASTNTTTGALVVTGGTGISGNLNVGGNVSITGSLTATIAHSSLTGLTADDHTQYALLAGRVGGQVLTGGTAASNILTLRSTTNATKGSVLIDETTASSSTTTGALRVAGGAGIVGNLFTGGTGNFAGILNATSGVNSSSTSTGSLVVSGGTGMDGNLYVGGTGNFTGIVTLLSGLPSTSTSTGALVVTGGTGISGNLNVGGNLNVTGTLTASIVHSSLTGLTADDHTQYALLSGRTGGQTLTGGSGISNNLVLRSTSNATKGSVLIDETTGSTSTITGALRVSGGTGIAGNLFAGGSGNFAGILNATSGTVSTSTTTGALVVTGGAGISGGLFTGGTGNFAGILNATSGTASSSTTTGALVVTGGTGISGNLNVGGNVSITGSLTATIAHSSLTGLTADDHTQYALLAGRVGGQVLTGGTAASNILTLRSTTNATKGSVLIDETTASSSTTTGALRVAGGAGIVGNLNIGGNESISSGTASTSTTSGALVVNGGVGISGSIFTGVNVSVPTLTLPSTISITNPPSGNIRLYQDNSDGLLKSINNSGVVQIYQPTNALGDIPVNNGTTLSRFAVGSDNQMLIVNSGEALGLQWVDRPVFGTNYFSTKATAAATMNSTTFANRLTLTTGTLEAGSYIYVVSAKQSSANSNQEHEARVLLDTVQQDIQSFFGQNVNEWSVYFSDIVTLTAGVHTVELQYRRVGTGTITNRNVLIYLYRVA